MKIITKGKNMNNIKKIGLTALAGSLVAISAQAAEMTVSGATVLTYTSEDGTEVTGNPLGMKTNLAFTASGEVNGYNVSYMQTSKDQFAGMSSARLSVDMGDMGTIAFDQGSGSGLATIDDKTPTAAEEIWDGLDDTTAGRVGAAGSSGVVNYINTFSGVTFNAAVRQGSGTSNSDGASSAAGQSAMDFALTTDGSSMGVDGLAIGLGYGEAENGSSANTSDSDDEHMTAFANYSVGPVTFGYQMSEITYGKKGTANQEIHAWGLAFNVNENLSVSYGEREIAHQTDANTDEKFDGIAVAYTMGSMKIAGNMNDVSNSAGVDGTNDSMTEIAVSFAF
ncbi:porin [Candidatus Pelagibacter sp.]|nr:porin [Candidatus Pelagibacter sp.]